MSAPEPDDPTTEAAQCLIEAARLRSEADALAAQLAPVRAGWQELRANRDAAPPPAHLNDVLLAAWVVQVQVDLEARERAILEKRLAAAVAENHAISHQMRGLLRMIAEYAVPLYSVGNPGNN